jgi:hypothetical protein
MRWPSLNELAKRSILQSRSPFNQTKAVLTVDELHTLLQLLVIEDDRSPGYAD